MMDLFLPIYKPDSPHGPCQRSQVKFKPVDISVHKAFSIALRQQKSRYEIVSGAQKIRKTVGVLS
jgi:hypothetical protein